MKFCLLNSRLKTLLVSFDNFYLIYHTKNDEYLQISENKIFKYFTLNFDKYFQKNQTLTVFQIVFFIVKNLSRREDEHVPEALSYFVIYAKLKNVHSNNNNMIVVTSNVA